MRKEAKDRAATLISESLTDAQIYDPTETSVKGAHALFLLLDQPRAYNFPPRPEVH